MSGPRNVGLLVERFFTIADAATVYQYAKRQPKRGETWVIEHRIVHEVHATKGKRMLERAHRLMKRPYGATIPAPERRYIHTRQKLRHLDRLQVRP